MRAHYLQHVPFEGLGSIETWLADAGADVTRTAFFEGEALPSPPEVDLLVVMGGPMSVNDESRFGWLREEKAFIRNSVDRGTRVLGICLGAQLIAAAMGERVYRHSASEIGWFPVERLKEKPEEDAAGLPPTFTAFHWHGETFDLPRGAELLARSKGCQNQAFRAGNRVLGLQFHVETTPGSARALVEHCRHELVESRYVQTEEQILGISPEVFAGANAVMSGVLARLVSD